MSKQNDERDALIERSCRREVLTPRMRRHFTDEEWAELERAVLKPFFRMGGSAASVDRWIVRYEGDADDALQPSEWQISGRDGWVYRIDLNADVRAAWLPGDVMAYYPFSPYHC